MKFNHDPQFYNTKDAEIIVPIILEKFQPQSVVDIGCGLGSWLKVFQNHGISDITGIDGTWVDKSKLYIEPTNFIEHDFKSRSMLQLNKYDLAICLEVVEHLEEEYANNFLQQLFNLSDTIIFSAAIPFQDGENHVNLKWQSFWKDKFEMSGYYCYDIIRPRIWNDERVFFWYKQNILVYSKEKLALNFDYSYINIVHPDYFLKKNDDLENMGESFNKYKKGLGGVKNSFKTFLYSLIIKFFK